MRFEWERLGSQAYVDLDVRVVGSTVIRDADLVQQDSKGTI
jgi:hypothetical protein